MSYSWKQKVNTKSSTEAELVGVDDSFAYILWARYFLQEQGYDIEPSLLYQDNMSAILLETNGKASSSKRTKHIKVRYFYVKDKFDQGEIVVQHCPTEQMWTDINTKPKQGSTFCEFRTQMMGIKQDYNDKIYSKVIHIRPPEALSRANQSSRPTIATTNSASPVPQLDRETPQECVGAPHATTAERERTITIGSDVVENNDVDDSERSRVPLRHVQGQLWSMEAYPSMRRAGLPLRVAWRRAFVSRLTF